MMRPADAVVIGAGPAGLMAAEALLDAGLTVLLADHKPSPGRKLLMAGKSGLNLTRIETKDRFKAAYDTDALHPMINAFGLEDVQSWAEGLGQPTFTGSTGRLFPRAMKASPLLRAWLARLTGKGLDLRTRWRWRGWQDDALRFDTPEGPQTATPRATVLALGGASWARLGSDGAWADLLADQHPTPFAPSNAGLHVPWSAHMQRHFGQPLKGLAWRAGALHSRGEAMISARGLEGGGIYPLTPALRTGAGLTADLLPDHSLDSVATRLQRPRGKQSRANHIRKALALAPAAQALLMECARPLPEAPQALAARIKALTIPHQGPRPMDEAISTAGGLPFAALDASLMLKSRPGTFCAGEMLDWEAPTGGYLLTACFATGRWAGQGAARYARQRL